MHGRQQTASILTPGAGRPLAALNMTVTQLGKAEVTRPSVSDHRGPWLDVISYEGMERIRGSISQRRHPASPDSLRLSNLYRDTSEGLLAFGPTARKLWLLTTDVGLVDLDPPGQPVAAWAYQHRSQAVKHGPCGLVRPDVQHALDVQRRDTVLGRGEQPAHTEPYRQRGPRAIEDRACRHRGAGIALRAPESAVAHAPTTGMAAVRAHKSVAPSQPLQVVEAVGVRRKPGV